MLKTRLQGEDRRNQPELSARERAVGINYSVRANRHIMKWQYKEEKPQAVREAEARSIREKHPDRVPVIVEKVAGQRIPDLDRKKYLVPGDLTVAQFMHVLRQRIQLGATESIFLMVGGVAPTTGSTMNSIYDQHKDEDGFLYMAYSGENSMG